MLKKIIATILIIFGVYILLIFFTPGFTDSLESKIGITFSKKVRFFKKVLDGKKSFSDFKKYIYEDNPDIKKAGESIDSSISGVKNFVDSGRKKLLDTKKSIDDNVEMVESGIKKVKETKEKIEDITKILKDKPKLNDSVEDKIDEKITKEIIKKENSGSLEVDKIEYEIMGDINDF